MRIHIFAGFILATASALSAADTHDDALAACRALTDDAERLSCYDAIDSSPVSAPSAPVAPALESPPAKTAVSAAPVPVPAGPKTSSTAAPVAPAAPATSPTDAAAVPAAEAPQDAERRFGLEQIEEANADRIDSRITGDFDGWWGGTVFRLENGQVWVQAQSGKSRYKGDPNPKVTIRRRAFGSYRLQVEGSNKTIRVKRVE